MMKKVKQKLTLDRPATCPIKVLESSMSVGRIGPGG